MSGVNVKIVNMDARLVAMESGLFARLMQIMGGDKEKKHELSHEEAQQWIPVGSAVSSAFGLAM